MAVCPNGHDSASDDFCDVCGVRISGAPGTPASSPAAGLSPAGSAPPQPGPGYLTQPAAADSCPRCGTPRTGQFCEACGFNFSGPRFTPSVPSVPPSPSTSSFPYPQATWTVVVGADRAYYERVQALTGPEGAAVTFPAYCAERRFQLVGNQMRIGRRSVSRGLSPEIDLTGPPADPGISRLHAVLVAMPDGSWAVLDPGSANGTLVNGSEIGIGDQVPLQDGDRINLGAWTAISVRRG
ncbi:MAG: FHA domain-containing protein [Streptosporangiaceae bacterium]